MDPAKTQGFVIRGYNLAFTRYIALSVTDKAQAKAFIAALLPGEQAWPRVTTAQQWLPPKPDRCLNIGFTFPGLAALDMPQSSRDSLLPDHQSFCQGSAASAQTVGDIGASAPGGWRLTDRQFDVMLILWGETQEIIDEDTALLMSDILKGFADPRADRIFDAEALEDRKVWFGYRDGIAQPHIAGIPYLKDPDGGQRQADPSAFMLGTGDQTQPYSGPKVPQPQAFGLHGCFGAFRMLHQDVDGFEAQAERLGKEIVGTEGITRLDVAIEVVKARISGRWTNGVPLALCPVDGDNLPKPMLDNQLNNFLYVLPNGQPDVDPTVDPDLGSHCPVGAHTRRGNMRGSPLGDTPAVYHRIMRRADAYQIPAGKPQAGERGLMGFFLCSSLSNQFEFVQQSWINTGNGFASVLDTTDPMMGTDTAGSDDGRFFETVGVKPNRSKMQGMQSFVTTVASAYCFFPSTDGLAWMAAQPGSA